MKKFRAIRKKITFEYEFKTGETVKLEYFEPTTQQIDSSLSIGDNVEDRLRHTKDVLKASLRADNDEFVDKLIEEQTEHANIYEFKNELDEELGKLKKRG